jgi:hypothetical protein
MVHGCDDAMRTHPCVRLFCIIDTLTSASMLPGIEDIIREAQGGVVRAGHGPFGNMSRYAPIRKRLEPPVFNRAPLI